MLPTAITAATHHREMPESPMWSGNQTRVGPVSRRSKKGKKKGQGGARQEHRSRGDESGLQQTRTRWGCKQFEGSHSNIYTRLRPQREPEAGGHLTL